MSLEINSWTFSFQKNAFIDSNLIKLWLLEKNKGPGARAGHFPSFFSLFYNAKNPFFRKIHSFSKPVPLPPVRKS